MLLFLDEQVGSGNYTVFLTADHGVAHVPGFLMEKKVPAGQWNSSKTIVDINDKILQQFGIRDAILSEQNYQLYLDKEAINEAGFDVSKLEYFIIDELKKVKGIHYSFPLHNLANEVLPKQVKDMLVNGFHPDRSGHIQVVLEAGWIDGWLTGTSHGLWYNYDSHIPMLFYGGGIKQGKSYQKYEMTDFAPTIAALLHIQVPSGSIGRVVTEALK